MEVAQTHKEYRVPVGHSFWQTAIIYRLTATSSQIFAAGPMAAVAP